MYLDTFLNLLTSQKTHRPIIFGPAIFFNGANFYVTVWNLGIKEIKLSKILV